jgi:glycosyltransferase involved in cell wall biosynthesis
VRVLHVVPGISPKYGGPTNIPGLLRALIRHGVDATLITTDNDPDGRLDVPLNVRIERDGVPQVFHHVWPVARRFGFAPSLLTTMRRTFRSYDLVHIHWLYNFACVAAARTALAADVPFVVQPRASLDPHMRKKNELVKRAYLATLGRPLLRDAAAIVFTAEDERILAAYGPRRPEWVIPNGLDLAAYERLPPRGTFRAAVPALDGPFLLFLGRLSRQKGLDLLLPAFQRVLASRPDLKLVLAGPDHEGHEREVRTLAQRLGVADRVVFPGMITGDLKLAALVDADLFVLPSYAENFGGVIIEALACGLPVLISDQVNIHRELSDAGVATVVSTSVDAVASGMASALADTDARQRMATLGPAFVGSRYSWDAIVPGLIARYSDVIAQDREGRLQPARRETG